MIKHRELSDPSSCLNRAREDERVFVLLEPPTTILVTSKSASKRLGELAEQFTADAVDPLEYKCLRCHCEWEREAGYEWRTAVCSNCYSERVVITVVRLGFENWGEQNGGAAEQRKRFDAAVRATRKATVAVRAIK